MSLAWQKRREIILEVLFSFEFQKGDEKEIILLLMQEHKVSKKNAFEAYAAASEIFLKKECLDASISQISHSFDISRIHLVERNILRLAFWELFFEKKLPKEIIISEAKRLGSKFATKEAASFIHGLIDGLLKEKEKSDVRSTCLP